MPRQPLVSVFTLFFCFFIFGNASAQPAAPNPVSPQGAIAESSPDFTWAAVPDALFYLLFVQDTNGVLHSNWHSATDAGCDSGAGNCTINPALSLDDIPKEWAVMAWNNVGTSPLSVIMSFFVGAPHITSAVKNNQSIEINGTHLHTGTDPTVDLGGTALTVTAKDVNGEQVTATIPAGTAGGAYELSVSHENGSDAIDFNLAVGGVSSFVLKDGNGNQIGEVYNVRGAKRPQVYTRLPVALSNSNEVFVGINFTTENRFGVEGSGVFFESSDCTGTPYIFFGQGVFNSAFRPKVQFDESFSLGITGPLTGPVRLYVATSLTKTDIQANSELIWSAVNFCSTYSQTFDREDVVPVELVDSDLLNTYPPPYTLEGQ